MIFSWRAGLPLPIPRLPSGSSQASVPISNAGTRTRLVHVDPSQHPEARRVLQPSPTKPKNKSAEPVFPIRASLPISISPSLTHRSSRLRTIPKVSSSSSIDAIQDVWPNKRKTTLPSSPLDCASWKRVRLTDTYPTPPASNRSSASLIELKAQSRRMSLQQQWSDLARNDRGAERVSFVNTVNDEAVPDGLEGFVYLEHSYRLPPQLGSVPCLDLESRELHPATPLTDRDRLVYCDCKPGCTNADQCTCQSNCEEAGYAYTDGLFNFTYHKNQIVVECNPYCSCPETCPNRVAQRPRHIPIEIFRTEKQGWGARTSVPIQRGRVLGLYTGKLIPRLEAETLANAAYCFDLDFNDEQVDDPTCLLSVDSCSYGTYSSFRALAN
ncbi:unnamed protein product [Mycena citricolor]|uniref:Pre-SET domain-containing protein n=1 Tax=Mycena citricolor TaxID=2018698 RepID=A0AAD2Q306_9AGAR|nr:unnamed protein product [Mycena citricolor]